MQFPPNYNPADDLIYQLLQFILGFFELGNPQTLIWVFAIIGAANRRYKILPRILKLATAESAGEVVTAHGMNGSGLQGMHLLYGSVDKRVDIVVARQDDLSDRQDSISENFRKLWDDHVKFKESVLGDLKDMASNVAKTTDKTLNEWGNGIRKQLDQLARTYDEHYRWQLDMKTKYTQLEDQQKDFSKRLEKLEAGNPHE